VGRDSSIERTRKGKKKENARFGVGVFLWWPFFRNYKQRYDLNRMLFELTRGEAREAPKTVLFPSEGKRLAFEKAHRAAERFGSFGLLISWKASKSWNKRALDSTVEFDL
jgi:hypothetical protein